MKNFKLEKVFGGGWCITIDDKDKKPRYKQILLTSTEIWALAKVITDRGDEILFEMRHEK